MKNITKDDLLNALDSVIWYNNDYDTIKLWMEALKNPTSNVVYRPDTTNDAGLEVLWMICVELFGDYGTSPRGGWIDDCESCI